MTSPDPQQSCDLVKTLRGEAANSDNVTWTRNLFDEAADAIEILRAALADIKALMPAVEAHARGVIERVDAELAASTGEQPCSTCKGDMVVPDPDNPVVGNPCPGCTETPPMSRSGRPPGESRA